MHGETDKSFPVLKDDRRAKPPLTQNTPCTPLVILYPLLDVVGPLHHTDASKQREEEIDAFNGITHAPHTHQQTFGNRLYGLVGMIPLSSIFIR